MNQTVHRAYARRAFGGTGGATGELASLYCPRPPAEKANPNVGTQYMQQTIDVRVRCQLPADSVVRRWQTSIGTMTEGLQGKDA
jgi:hypothetical protein